MINKVRYTTAITTLVLTIALLVVPVLSSATGNGAPSGDHYNLNLIGVPKNKTAEMTNNDGHRIFVPLWGKTKILLQEGATFNVLDANGTDGAAKFQLPNPDPDNDGVTVYSVWVRAVGKPGGKATLATCATSAGLDGIFGTADDEDLGIVPGRRERRLERTGHHAALGAKPGIAAEHDVQALRQRPANGLVVAPPHDHRMSRGHAAEIAQVLR